MFGVMNKNHLVLNIYASGDYKYNVVRDSDLESNIEFNKTLIRLGVLAESFMLMVKECIMVV